MSPYSAVILPLLLSLPTFGPARDSASTAKGHPERYNVVWDSPGKDFTGSMPLGNGEIGLNVWVEENGDLLFYIGRTDTWDENGTLLKVGKVRISINPRPETPLKTFVQTLRLIDGTVSVRFGEGAQEVAMRLWVDADHPLIHLEVESRQPTQAVASIELWRTAPFDIPATEASDVLAGLKGKDNQPVNLTVEPDSLLRNQRGRIGWYHHNVKSVGPEISARIQGLQGFKRPDPLLHRTFGAVITATGAEHLDDTHLASSSSRRHHFTICVLTRHPAKPKEWLRATHEEMAKAERVPPATLRKSHERWWKNFWNRSWIHVSPSRGRATGDSDAAYTVSRAYALQRFINGCAGRGEYPIKFNGSIFTVPFPGRPGDADYRQWGPGYWWQNTRLPYISMCASGDYDLLRPLFTMYGKRLMPLFKYRTRLYLNHDGAFIPECIFFWGEVFSATYGWTPFEERSDKLQESGYHKWEWVSGPELVWMMLDHYEHTLDRRFLREVALPTAHEILTFFDEHYGRDGSGKLVMYPSQACETWWDCTNPMPELAGLHAVVERLLSLPATTTGARARAFWAKLKAALPDLPTKMENGTTMLAAADRFAEKRNVENPELYAVFPFRLVSFEKSNRNLGIEAFLRRQDRGNFGWRQDDIFAAYLGLADTAREYLVGRAQSKHAGSRFPAFWGPNYDWIPDQDHGSILLKTLQAMILQTDGRMIYLFPAWPRGWDVDFKLHAPFRTVIEGNFHNGVAKILKVTPRSRLKDIHVMKEE
jgi:alpha-L-fucosidase 2